MRSHAMRTPVACLALSLLVLPLCARAGHAYVSNEDDRTVSVIDTTSETVVATIPVGKRPRGMRLSRDGSRLYVAVSGLPKCPPTTPDAECAKFVHDVAADGIAVVDTHARKVIRRLEAGSDPERFDMSRDDRRLYASNEDSGSASAIDVQTGAVVGSVSVGAEPEGVRVSPNGAWVAVTSETNNTVSLIDTRTLKVVHTFTVGKRPRDVVFTPDGRTAYVPGEFDASIYKITMPSGPVVKLLQLRREDRPASLLLDARRGRLYAATGRGGTVAVIGLKGPKLLGEVAVGPRPWGIALTPDGRRLYTANGPSNDVTVVDTRTLKVIKKIPVGHSPWGVVIGR